MILSLFSFNLKNIGEKEAIAEKRWTWVFLRNDPSINTDLFGCSIFISSLLKNSFLLFLENKNYLVNYYISQKNNEWTIK